MANAAINKTFRQEAEESYERNCYKYYSNSGEDIAYIDGYIDRAKQDRKQIKQLLEQIDHMKCCENCGNSKLGWEYNIVCGLYTYEHQMAMTRPCNNKDKWIPREYTPRKQ